MTDAANRTGLSEDKVRELLQQEMAERLAARDRATLDLMDVREDFRDRFGKRMNVGEFETFVADRRKAGSGDSLQALYKDWIEPQAKEVEDKALEERIKRERDDAVKDFASRNRIPTASRPRETSILMDRIRAERDQAEGVKEGELSSREEFLAILNDPEPETLGKRFPA